MVLGQFLSWISWKKDTTAVTKRSPVVLQINFWVGSVLLRVNHFSMLHSHLQIIGSWESKCTSPSDTLPPGKNALLRDSWPPLSLHSARKRAWFLKWKYPDIIFMFHCTSKSIWQNSMWHYTQIIKQPGWKPSPFKTLPVIDPSKLQTFNTSPATSRCRVSQRLHVRGGSGGTWSVAVITWLYTTGLVVASGGNDTDGTIDAVEELDVIRLWDLIFGKLGGWFRIFV